MLCSKYIAAEGSNTGTSRAVVGMVRRRLTIARVDRFCSSAHHPCSSSTNLVVRKGRPQNIDSYMHDIVSRYNHHASSSIRTSSTTIFPEYSCPSFVIPTTQQSSTQQQQLQAILVTTPIRVNVNASTTTISTTFLSTQQQHQQTIPLDNNTAHIIATAAVLKKNGNASCSDGKLQTSDLRALFIASSIPMIGFGFMDQFVLIQAGGYIDATFGISFGLATLSAAAAGQVVSDVSGVVFGGALERFLTTNTSWLRTPNISQLQRQLPICRNVAMLGAIVGVIIGCAIGATSLLFVDLEARNRMERAQRLRDIVQDMITSAVPKLPSVPRSELSTTEVTTDQVFPCDSCTVYVVSTKDLTLPIDHDSDQWKVNLKDISSSVATTTTPTTNSSYSDAVDEIKTVQQCITARSIVLSDDRRIMYAPLIKRGMKTHDTTGTSTSTPPNDIMAVVAFRYSNDDEFDDATKNTVVDDGASRRTTECYSDEDVITARVMARHIAIFMDR